MTSGVESVSGQSHDQDSSTQRAATTPTINRSSATHFRRMFPPHSNMVERDVDAIGCWSRTGLRLPVEECLVARLDVALTRSIGGPSGQRDRSTVHFL